MASAAGRSAGSDAVAVARIELSSRSRAALGPSWVRSAASNRAGISASTANAPCAEGFGVDSCARAGAAIANASASTANAASAAQERRRESAHAPLTLAATVDSGSSSASTSVANFLRSAGVSCVYSAYPSAVLRL